MPFSGEKFITGLEVLWILEAWDVSAKGPVGQHGFSLFCLCVETVYSVTGLLWLQICNVQLVIKF